MPSLQLDSSGCRTMTLEALQVAVRHAHNRRGETFNQLLRQHREHPGFEAIQNAMERKIGFACTCNGPREEFWVELPTLLNSVNTYQNYLQVQLKGNKLRKRKKRKSNKKAEALLYRYLSKEQKWSIRAGEFFEVTGQDGHRYRLTPRTAGNVFRLDPEGKPTHQFCVVTGTTNLPINDLLLAQKVVLENDIESFMKVAVVTNIDLRPVEGNAAVPYINLPGRRPGSVLSRVLLHDDLPSGAQAVYDASIPFVLNEQRMVVPCYGTPFTVPRLTDPDVDTSILNLLMGIPARSYQDWTGVVNHFRHHDLRLAKVIHHSETEFGLAPHVQSIWDDHIPRGKVYCLTEDHCLGVVVLFHESQDKGFCIYNLNGVAIYDVP